MAKSNHMATPPPSAPEKVLQRVLFISAFDGWSVCAIGGLALLVTLLLGDLSGLVVCVLALVAGIMELRGRRKLQRRDPAGMKELVRAQLLLLAVVLVYCASRLGSFDQDTVLASLTPDMKAALKESGVEMAEIMPLVKTTFYAAYSIVALLALLFQGGLILYYRSKTPLVTEALTPPPVLPPNSPLAYP